MSRSQIDRKSGGRFSINVCKAVLRDSIATWSSSARRRTSSSARPSPKTTLRSRARPRSSESAANPLTSASHIAGFFADRRPANASARPATSSDRNASGRSDERANNAFTNVGCLSTSSPRRRAVRRTTLGILERPASATSPAGSASATGIKAVQMSAGMLWSSASSACDASAEASGKACRFTGKATHGASMPAQAAPVPSDRRAEHFQLRP